MKTYMLFDDAWVKTTMLSKKFKVLAQCKLCNRLLAGRIWHSIKTGKTT